MAVKQLTLNQTINLIKQIAQSHYQINSVYFGDIWEFLVREDNTYPAMFYSLTGSTIAEKNLAMNFSLFFLDRQLQDESNENEVLSDQLLIAQDIIAMLNYPKFDWEISDNYTLEFFTENEKDYLAGVRLDITINYPMVNDRCQIPSDFEFPDFTGSTLDGGSYGSFKLLYDYPTFNDFPNIGTVGKIYVANDTNIIYRWIDGHYQQFVVNSYTFWGGIQGTLSNQTDLQNALNAKADKITTITINGTTNNLSGNFSINTMPTGGTTGQLLAKASANNFDTTWIDDLREDVNPICKLGENISKGQAVYISSADGTNKIITKASNTQEITSSKTFGILSATGVTNDKIRVITIGVIDNIDTSSATAGDPVWLGTNGNLLYGYVNKPVAPAHLVFIGIVIRANANNGQIYVRVQNGFELDELHNVLLQNVTDKQALIYESSTGLWKNKSLFGGTGLFTTTDITEGTNLYYTQARFNTAFSGKSTTDLSEGTNKYYTDARFDARLALKTTSDITEGTNKYYTDARFDTSFSNKTTSNLTEGTNLYFTNARSRASLSFTAGSGAYNSTTGVITIPTNTNQLTNGALFINLSSLSATDPLSYNNTTGSFSISLANSTTNGYLSSNDWNTFNNKQNQLNGVGFIKANGTTISFDNSTYLTTISGITAGGELSGTYPNPTLVNSAVISKILTGLNITGGSITATDSILQAFGKLQNQLNTLSGAVIYQGTWNASTNTPTLTSSIGTKGYYYIVNVAGNTNLNNNTDWQIGDWVIFDGTTWQKVDNTDSVSSVNGFTGAINLTTSNISEGSNLYLTNSRVINSTLTGYVSGPGTISATDSILSAIQKLNGNIGSLITGVSSVFGRTGSIIAQSGDYNTTLVTEGTNLYYTDTRARASISLTTTGTSGSATYNSTTGVLNIPQYQSVLTNPVTGTGTANYFPKFTGSTTIGNSQIVDDGTSVLIGLTSRRSSFNQGVTSEFQIEGLTFDTATASIVRNSNDVGAPSLKFGKTKGTTVLSNTAVTSGDFLGNIEFQGGDGTTLVLGSSIRSIVDGTVSTSNMPGALAFYTNGIGNTVTERMRIASNGNVGIGSTNVGSTSLRVSKSITGGTIGYGFLSDGQTQSDVTNQAFYFSAVGSIQAATFTLSNLYYYSASQSTFGVGSTITNQTGYFVSSTLTGATNNFGFYGDLASATGRWNLYMNGTANNYLAGKLGIGVTTPSENISIAGSTATTFGLSLSPSGWNNAKHRFIVPTSGDSSIISFNYNGSVVDSASYATASIGVGNGILLFNTAGINTAPSERMRITATGNVLIGSTTTQSGRLDVVSTYQANTPSKANSTAYFNNGGIGIYVGSNAYSYSYIQSEQTDTTATKNLIIQPLGGNIGIGTTNIPHLLTVNGNIGFQTTGTQKYHIGYFNGGLNFSESGVADYRIFIKDGGNILIGTSTDSGYKLDVIGNTRMSTITVTSGYYDIQPTPTALTASATLTIAQIQGDLITVTSSTAVSLTLPTGTLTDAGVLGGTLQTDGCFDWYIINLGSLAGAVTMVAGTGHTYVGNATVAINTSAQFRTRKTATNTFITYRVN